MLHKKKKNEIILSLLSIDDIMRDWKGKILRDKRLRYEKDTWQSFF